MDEMGKHIYDSLNRDQSSFGSLPKLPWAPTPQSFVGPWDYAECNGERFERKECDIRDGKLFVNVRKEVFDEESSEDWERRRIAFISDLLDLQERHDIELTHEEILRPDFRRIVETPDDEKEMDISQCTFWRSPGFYTREE